ncbi:MAG: hypothetical protein K1X88_25585 [Nannocystaceae bacterium]|nr:hypothetical protein [Nannocystaceae bacterium]
MRQSWVVVGLVVSCTGATPAGSGETSSGGGGSGSDADSASAGSSSTAGSGDSGADGSAHVVGVVEKGPFILGSSVTLALLDDGGSPTGLSFPAQVTDDRGSYAVDLPGTLAAASASGFAYDEVGGALSGAPIQLDAVVVVEGPALEQRINVLTDLQADRARALIAAGTAPASALDQAQDELVAALPIGVGYVPTAAFETLGVYGDGDLDNAYVVAVGAAALQAAHEQAGEGDASAQLQALVNATAIDLADDGALQPQRAQIWHLAGQHVDTTLVLANLQSHAQQLGVPFSAPPLAAMFDHDDDGVDDELDNCVGVVNPDQADANGDGEGDACANCSDPSLPDGDGDGIREPCDNCMSPNVDQVDGDDDGIGNACDSCPMTPEGESGPCCDPRAAASWCREPDGAIPNTGCNDGPGGFTCNGLVDLGLNGYGDDCIGGCFGYGATCVGAGAFPARTVATGSSCDDGEACCSKYCTVGANTCGNGDGYVAPPTCLQYYPDGEAPTGLETLGICVDTTQGPCAAPGATGRICAG